MGECSKSCPICKQEYFDEMTKDRHYNFYHLKMEYSREVGKEWEMFIESV